MKKMKKLICLTALVIAAMISLPSDSAAAKMCDYEYYYDAAHTQFAGYCQAACYAGGNTCHQGTVITEYYALVNCRPGCIANGGEPIAPPPGTKTKQPSPRKCRQR